MPTRELAVRAGAAGLAIAALVGFAWWAQRSEAPQAHPEWQGPPVVARDETRPKLGEIPNLKLMGAEPGPSTDALCDASRVERMSQWITQRTDDAVFVEPAVWDATPSGGRAGLASFWSKCLHAGAAIEIRSEGDGQVLALYDPVEGLTGR